MKTKTYSIVLLVLLFAQKVHKASGNCSYDEHLKQCSCSLLDLTNFKTIRPCVLATSFEFNGGTYIDLTVFDPQDIKPIIDRIPISLTKISFVNMVLSEDFLAAYIDVMSQVPVGLLSFENTTFVDQSFGFNVMRFPSLISALQFINTSSNPLMKRSAFDRFHSWMSTLRTLIVKESQLSNVSCDISSRFRSLSTLELSENLLADDKVSSMFCDGSFPRLQTLRLSSHNFSNYETLCQAVSKYKRLRHLDLSRNDFSAIPNSLCEWQPSLRHLNLSNTGLEQVGISLPPNCEVLDLSLNRIEFLNMSLPTLKELYLSYNRLSTLSSVGHIPLLQILAVDGNPIKMLQVSEIQSFKHLASFKGDNVPYSCSCSFIKEMKEMANSNFTIELWPEGYTCDSPESVRSKPINDVNHSFFECHTQLLTAIICIVMLLLCVSIVICFVKICRSNKTRSPCMESGTSNNL